MDANKGKTWKKNIINWKSIFWLQIFGPFTPKSRVSALFYRHIIQEKVTMQCCIVKDKLWGLLLVNWGNYENE